MYISLCLYCFLQILSLCAVKPNNCCATAKKTHSPLRTQQIGDPADLVRRLSIVGEVCVIDLDAAHKTGTNNTEVLFDLIRQFRIRVGGGISDVDEALAFLDKGASKVVIGSAASVEFFSEIPRDRLVCALDVELASEGYRVVVEGRSRKTEKELFAAIAEYKDYVGEFLVAFVEQQGTLSGIEAIRPQLELLAKAKARVCVAGGITSVEDVLYVDSLGLYSQVGTALITDKSLAGGIIAGFTKSDRPDGLYTTVVVDEQGVALGLVYSNDESIIAAVREGKGIYHSRRRGLWEKGLSSGDTQTLLRVDLDCDRDAIRFTVKQHGKGFCHLERRTCWDADSGLGHLFRTLQDRKDNPDPKSYTNRLLQDEALLNAKLREESEELIEAKEFDVCIFFFSFLFVFVCCVFRFQYYVSGVVHRFAIYSLVKRLLCLARLPNTFLCRPLHSPARSHPPLSSTTTGRCWRGCRCYLLPISYVC